MTEKNFLDFEAAVFLANGRGYAASFETNGLYEVNLYEKKCRYIMFFPNENISGKRIYGSAVYYDSKIYFIPMSGKYISIFDINKREITQVPVPSPSTKCSFYKWGLKFCKGIYHEGYIYLIPFTYPGILKLDVRTNKITIINNWIPDEEYFFRGGVCVDGSQIYVPSGINNIVLEFNVETDYAIIHRVGKYNHGGVCIHKYNDSYVIAPRLKGSVIIWNPNTDEICEIVEYPDEFKTEKLVFSQIICCGNQLFLMPASANTVISFDKDMRGLIIEEKWKPSDNSMVACMFETDDYYYFREHNNSSGKHHHYRIRKMDGKTEDYAFVVENNEEFKKDFFDTSTGRSEVMRENENFKLGDFLKLI